MLCFVTVGTTYFDELVAEILNDNNLTILRDTLKVDELCVQFGTGQLPDGFTGDSELENEDSWTDERNGIQIRLIRFSSAFSELMRQADIIIGHAGAGTCLEALDLGKPFVVVINEGLADNHQIELAQRLARDGHLLCTIPEELAKTLQNPKLFHLERFPKADPQVFAKYLNEFVNVA